jgi:hypothetical protein
VIKNQPLFFVPEHLFSSNMLVGKFWILEGTNPTQYISSSSESDDHDDNDHDDEDILNVCYLIMFRCHCNTNTNNLFIVLTFYSFCAKYQACIDFNFCSFDSSCRTLDKADFKYVSCDFFIQ